MAKAVRSLRSILMGRNRDNRRVLRDFLCIGDLQTAWPCPADLSLLDYGQRFASPAKNDPTLVRTLPGPCVPSS